MIFSDLKFAMQGCALNTNIGSRGYNCWKEWRLCTLVFGLDQFWHCDVFVIWVSAVLIPFAPLVVSVLKYSLYCTQCFKRLGTRLCFEHEVGTATPSVQHVLTAHLLSSIVGFHARFFLGEGKFLWLARHTLFFHENGCSLVGWLVTWYQHAQHLKLHPFFA